MSSAAELAKMDENNPGRLATQTRPFYWSVRRELWEYHSIWIAPLAAAVLVLFGFALRALKLPHMLNSAAKLSPMAKHAAMAAPFAFAAGAIIVTGLIVSIFYCLGALNNERRDRSILFWKSLPVSDSTTVLSKAFVPFVVLPAVVLAIAVLTQLVMLLLGSAVLLANRIDPATLWTQIPLLQISAVMVYFVVINVLWYAPIFGWLLMVSSWARRMAFLWATLPWLGLAVVEKIALDSHYVWSFLTYRSKGTLIEGFTLPPAPHNPTQVIDPLSLLAPAHFFSTPGLWLGLIAAAIFIGAAVWFRRMRDPG
ncbi:MAG: ABC transporter permease [Rhizomicrobium sp.]|jgi:ABC-2 type transport system permease protein